MGHLLCCTGHVQEFCLILLNYVELNSKCSNYHLRVKEMKLCKDLKKKKKLSFL